MSSTFSAVLDVQVTGQDQVQGMTTSISSLNTTITEGTDASGQMTTSMSGQVAGFTRVAGSAALLMGSFMQLTRMQMMVQIAGQTLEQRQLTLQNAQLTYNQAVAKYGPTSDQAIKAHNNLEKATLSLDRAQQRLQFDQMQEYTMLLPMALGIISSVASAYDVLTTSKTAQKVITDLLNSSLLEEVTLEDMLTLGLGAVAGIAGTALLMNYMGSHGSTSSAPTGVPSYQGGGTLGTSGLIYGHAGETLISPYGGSSLGGLGAGSGGAGGIGTVAIELGVNARQMLQILSVEYEYEGQRRGQFGYGA